MVGALEQAHPGLRDLFEAGLNDVLALVSDRQLALGDGLLEKLQALGELVRVIQNDETLGTRLSMEIRSDVGH